MTTHAKIGTGESTLCHLYCGFHRPLAALFPAEGWQNVTCKNCRKKPLFKLAKS